RPAPRARRRRQRQELRWMDAAHQGGVRELSRRRASAAETWRRSRRLRSPGPDRVDVRVDERSRGNPRDAERGQGEEMGGGFQAFRVCEEDGRVGGRVVNATLEELGVGGLLIKASHSSVNYKDALAATGAGKIIRRFPLIAGVDVAGTVLWSDD